MTDEVGEVDLVFWGSSRGEYGFNPIIVDSLLNLNAYNMCTSSQDMIESYFILCDILSSHHPRFIVLDLFLPSFSVSNDYYQVISSSDEFNSAGLKFEMILKGYGLNGLMAYMIPIAKQKYFVRRAIDDFILGKRFFKKKKEDDFHNNGKELVSIKMKKGYLEASDTINPNDIVKFFKIEDFYEIKFSKKKVEYFYKIALLCRSKNIELICVTVPFPPSLLKISSGYESVYKFFVTLTSNALVKYCDFNRDVNNTYYDYNYKESNHLNKNGAQKFTSDFCQAFQRIKSPI